jgi:hypothetical protein
MISNQSCCPTPPVFTIFLGDAKTMPFMLIVAQTRVPRDLTACSNIVINLPNADGSITQLSLEDSEVAITSPPILGQFTTPISSEVSQLLNVGELQDIFVTFTISGSPFTVRYVQALTVYQP